MARLKRENFRRTACKKRANRRLEQINMESPVAETTKIPGMGRTIVNVIKTAIVRLMSFDNLTSSSKA